MKSFVVSRNDDGVEKDMYYYYVCRMREFYYLFGLMSVNPSFVLSSSCLFFFSFQEAIQEQASVLRQRHLLALLYLLST